MGRKGFKGGLYPQFLVEIEIFFVKRPCITHASPKLSDLPPALQYPVKTNLTFGHIFAISIALIAVSPNMYKVCLLSHCLFLP